MNPTKKIVSSILCTVAAVNAFQVVSAGNPLTVTNTDKKRCMSTNMITHVVNGFPLASVWDCMDPQKSSSQWQLGEGDILQVTTDTSKCATRVTRSIGIVNCNDSRVKEISKWEAYEPNNLRMKKGHGYRVGDVELRCVEPSQDNTWDLLYCDDEANPCAKGQCLSKWGYCGNTERHCNADSLRGLAGVPSNPPENLLYDPPKLCPSAVLTDKQIDGVVLASTRECVKDGWQVTDQGQYKLKDVNLCGTRVGRSMGLKPCDAPELSLWEKHDSNGARLQKGQGFVLNQAELRCLLPKADTNSWEFAFCADEPNPCPKGQCLNEFGECGSTSNHCNEKSLRGLSQIKD